MTQPVLRLHCLQISEHEQIVSDSNTPDWLIRCQQVTGTRNVSFMRLLRTTSVVWVTQAALFVLMPSLYWTCTLQNNCIYSISEVISTYLLRLGGYEEGSRGVKWTGCTAISRYTASAHICWKPHRSVARTGWNNQHNKNQRLDITIKKKCCGSETERMERVEVRRKHWCARQKRRGLRMDSEWEGMKF